MPTTAASTPVETGSDEQVTGEDKKETIVNEPAINSSPSPTQVTGENINIYHSDVSGSPTLPPQVDSGDNDKPVELVEQDSNLHDSDKPVEPAKQDSNQHDSDKPVEPAEQDSNQHDSDKPVEPAEQDSDQHDSDKPAEPAEQGGNHYKPQSDNEGEEKFKEFEFDTEEELERWSDQMKHMSHEEESYNKGEESDFEKDDKVEETEDDKDKGKEIDRLPEEEEEKEESEEEEVENEEEEDDDGDEEEEDKEKAQEIDIEQIDKEATSDDSSEISREEVTNEQLTPSDHEKSQEYLPNDEEDTVSGEDDPRVFEKIAEELAANKYQELEESFEEQLEGKTEQENLQSEILPVTTVTESLEITPSTTHESNVVMATVGSDEESADENIQRNDDSRTEMDDKLPDDINGKDTGEQLEHHKIDKTPVITIKQSDNDEIPEIQQKYDQEHLNNIEIPEIHQKHEQVNHSDSEIPRIHEKEEIENDEIQKDSNLEYKSDENIDDVKDFRNNAIQKDENDKYSGKEEIHEIQQKEEKDEEIHEMQQKEEKDEEIHEIQQKEEKDEEIQQNDDDEVKQRDEENLREENLEKQKLHQRAENLARGVIEKDDEKDERKEDEYGSDKMYRQEQLSDDIQPSEELSTSTLVEMTHDVSHTTSSPAVTPSVSMTIDDDNMAEASRPPVSIATDDSHDNIMAEDDYKMLEDQISIKIVHKSDTTNSTTAYHVDHSGDINSRQSGNVCVVYMCVCCVCVCVLCM